MEGQSTTHINSYLQWTIANCQNQDFQDYVSGIGRSLIGHFPLSTEEWQSAIRDQESEGEMGKPRMIPTW